jgi:hypothetical protein
VTVYVAAVQERQPEPSPEHHKTSVTVTLLPSLGQEVYCTGIVAVPARLDLAEELSANVGSSFGEMQPQLRQAHRKVILGVRLKPCYVYVVSWTNIEPCDYVRNGVSQIL